MLPPVLAVGDGALGFWAAARKVWPETREQGCWGHKLSNVLDKLPQRLHSRAKRALHEMMYAAGRSDCEIAKVCFAAEYQAKYPKAVESLTAIRSRHANPGQEHYPRHLPAFRRQASAQLFCDRRRRHHRGGRGATGAWSCLRCVRRVRAFRRVT